MTILVVARTLAEEIDARPLPESPMPIVLPTTDDTTQAGNAGSLGDAEGQSFIIEYVDASGAASRRRITVWAIVEGSEGIPCLIARCHERNAQRQFRVDRINTCIDYDGVVYDDVPGFMADNFGMDIAVARRTSANEDRRLRLINQRIKHDAVILAALARADGLTLSVETDAATNHLTWFAEQDGLMLNDDEILEIHRSLNRLRPTERAILKALNHVSAMGEKHVMRLLRAAVAVMDADGERHPAEIELINAVAIDLVGAPIYS